MGCKYCAAAGSELRVHERFEGFHSRCDGLAKREFADDGVGGLEAVAGDADDSGFDRRRCGPVRSAFL